MTTNPSIISHVSLGTNDFAKAAAFYDAVLETLGCRRVMEFPETIAYGKAYAEFWLHPPLNDQTATAGNGTHISFVADTKAAVDQFHAAALAAGAQDEGAPGPREAYGAPYYGCFVRDLDGHKIEATYWDAELARELGLG